VFFLLLTLPTRNICVTNICKNLTYTFARSIKCNRTRITDMKSLRNLFYLVHRTNVVDSSRIKKRKKKKNDNGCFSPFPSFTIITLIMFEQRCICEWDPLPWQDAVTRSVTTNETAIKCICSYFCLQSSHSCICIWSWHRIEKKRKEKLRIESCFRHIKKNVSIFFSSLQKEE